MKTGLFSTIALLLCLSLLSCSTESGIWIELDGETVESIAPEDQSFQVKARLSDFGSESNLRVDLTAVETTDGNDILVTSGKIDLGGAENQGEFTFSLPRDWPVGSYRLDAYVDDSLAMTKEFEVRGS